MLPPLASVHTLLPPGFPVLIDRLKRGGVPHLERVQYRGHNAWEVDAAALRHQQREWAREQYATPSTAGALGLLGQSATLLSRPLPVRRQSDGREAYQWRARYWREELCLLRCAALFWLMHHAASVVAVPVFLAADGWLGESVLSADELDLSLPHPDGYPVLQLSVGDVAVAAATPAIDARWDGAPIVERVRDHRVPVADDLQPEDLAPQLWAYLPTDPACPANFSYASTAAYPDQACIERNATGRRSAPAWLQVRREAADAAAGRTPARRRPDARTRRGNGARAPQSPAADVPPPAHKALKRQPAAVPPPAVPEKRAPRRAQGPPPPTNLF